MCTCEAIGRRDRDERVCELCLPRMSRRRALGLAGAATTAALLGRPDPTAAARAFQTGYGVAIEPRAAWAGDSRPVLGDTPDENVKFLLVHHTAGPSQGDPVALIREIYDFHTGADKGWPDVAYNFFVEPGGRVFEGRAGSLQRAVQASATGGNQGFSQLVCLIGDFTNRNPTSAQLVSLNETLAWLADRYGLDTSRGATETFTSRGSNKWSQGTQVTADTISGHREMSATACPGDAFFPYLKDRVQAEVHVLRGSPPAPAQEPSTDPSRVPDSTTVPVPADSPPPPTAPRSSPSSSGPTSLPSGGVPTTSARHPSSQITLPTTSAPPTTIPASTAPATVTDGPVISPPAPRADEFAIDPPDQAQAGSGRTSSNATAWGLGAAAASVVAAAAVYVGVRDRHRATRDDDETSTSAGEPLRPSSGGGDPPN